jgi:hypothetical protein
MALTLQTTLADDILDALDTEINSGTAQTGGKLVIETTADAEISLHRFSNPAFGASASGTITMASPPKDDTNATAGTAAQFSIYDRDDTKILEGVVQVTGADLDLSSLAVGAGDTVSLTSFTISILA